MNRRVALILSLHALNFAGPATAAELTPHDFAFGMPIHTADDSALYRITVPTEVYRYSTRNDLGDVRVFNASGESVPYSLTTPAEQQGPRAALERAPMFPLRGDPVQALDHFRVTIASGKSSVDLQTNTAARPSRHVQAYLLDVRTLDKPISAVELKWAPDAEEFSGHVRVDGSDNLGQWHTLIDVAPVVNLRFGDQRLVQNRVEFGASRYKFLRLQWQEQHAALMLTEVWVQPAASHSEPTRVTAQVVAQVVGTTTDATDTFEFDLHMHAPVDRLNIKLPQINSLTSATLASRDQPTTPWRNVATLNLYELRNNGQTVRNPDFVVTRTTHRYWRMQTQPGAIGEGAPTLQVAWVPHELTFVARGTAPFQLAFGSAAIQSATTALSQLTHTPNGIHIGTATVGTLHELGGPTRLQVRHALPWKSWLLWAALVAAIGILAGVAYRLWREMSK